jgi:hypothetical protein
LTDPNPTSGAPSPNHAVSLRARLLGLWSKAATILAIIGLVDLTHQLIEWAEAIHQIATKYATVSEALFAWLPFHVPHEWHNVIVLGAVFCSVINVGYYQNTGKLYVIESCKALLPDWFRRFNKERLSPTFWRTLDELTLDEEWTIDQVMLSISVSGGVICMVVFTISISIVNFLHSLALYNNASYNVNVYWNRINIVLLSLSIFLFVGSLLAWRWILVTAGLFGGLFTINEIYLAWLKKWSV